MVMVLRCFAGPVRGLTYRGSKDVDLLVDDEILKRPVDGREPYLVTAAT